MNICVQLSLVSLNWYVVVLDLTFLNNFPLEALSGLLCDIHIEGGDGNPTVHLRQIRKKSVVHDLSRPVDPFHDYTGSFLSLQP